MENDLGTGSGYTIEYLGNLFDEKSYPLHWKCSVYQAELLAICAALDRICKSYLLTDANSVLIITDSLSSIGAINQFWSDNPVVHSIKE